MLRESPQARPNIYQVLREGCAMQGRDVPIHDVGTLLHRHHGHVTDICTDLCRKAALNSTEQTFCYGEATTKSWRRLLPACSAEGGHSRHCSYEKRKAAGR